jgi:flagellar protein FliJ
MTKPFSFQPLISLAQHRKDSATQKLGQLNRQQHNAQSKLEMLQQYRKDYQARLQESAQNGINPAELRNFHEFIGKLDEAISQQLKLVGQSIASTQAGRGEFDAAQRKLKSFDTLQQRHLETQKKAAEKTEQKALDEHTGRAANYKAINAEDHTTDD